MADEFDDKDIKTVLNSWRESADRQADRDDWFWARQRARIVSRMQQPAVKRVSTLAWAGIAATVAVGVALMVPGGRTPNIVPTVNPQPRIEAQVSDHELMEQLQDTMNSNVPDALQPASTLAQEMEQSYRSKGTSNAKERTQ